MLLIVLRRIAAALPLLAGVLVLTFVLVESAPGHPADLLLGDQPIPLEARMRVERAWGLDRPPLERLGSWLTSAVFRGEWGWSFSRSQPVSTVVAAALPRTLALAGAALALHVLLGGGLALACVRRPGGLTDRLLSAGSLALYAMPTFWVGLMAILVFAHWIPLFPPSSVRSVEADAWPAWRRILDLAWHLALPATVLSTASAASLARYLRSGILQLLGEPFVRAARARGVSESRVLSAHALRNGLLPVISLVGLSLPLLVSGSLVIEVVFALPGMGRVAYEGILAKDLPLVLSCTLLASVTVIVGNLLADLALAAADPRVRLRGRGLAP